MRKLAEHSLALLSSCALAAGWSMFLPGDGVQFATFALAAYVAVMVAWKA